MRDDCGRGWREGKPGWLRVSLVTLNMFRAARW